MLCGLARGLLVGVALGAGWRGQVEGSKTKSADPPTAQVSGAYQEFVSHVVLGTGGGMRTFCKKVVSTSSAAASVSEAVRTCVEVE